MFPLLSAWLLYRDRVLLQISENIELLREEKGLHIEALTTSLKPWLELDSSRGNQLAQRMLNWQKEALETLGQAVELLLERKNRVWARVLIQLLSSCLDVNPKLNTWACKLNDAGQYVALCCKYLCNFLSSFYVLSHRKLTYLWHETQWSGVNRSSLKVCLLNFKYKLVTVRSV